MGFILTVIGILLLLLSLGGMAFGAYMAVDPKTRQPGKLFVVWWVPVVAAACGVFMRDVVTFAVGSLCFLVAGTVSTFEGRTKRKPAVKGTRESSEKTPRENEAAS